MASLEAAYRRRLQKLLSVKKPDGKPAKTAYKMHVALPLYMYPSSGVWQPLFDAVTSHPTVVFDVIVNPNSGPGGYPPDLNYIENVSQLNSYSNVHMLGYVHVSWGNRNISDVEADIDNYQQWSTYGSNNISMEGIFVDESPASTDYYPYMKEIYDHIKSTMTNGNRVWTNPGIPVDFSFYDIADFINAYENTYDAWANQGGNTSIPAALRSRSTVMLHSYPSDSSTMQSDVDNLIDGPYYGGLIITDSDYTSFDCSWPTFVAEVDQTDAETDAETCD